MLWLLWSLVTLPLRIVAWALRLVRFVGVGRIAAFGAGVATGMALAPASGAQLRSRVVGAQQAVAATGGDLGAVVRHELAHSPRTWHLPQPAVSDHDGRIVLTGTVPHEEARTDLVRTAGAVVGVRAVEDRLQVDAL